MIGQITGYDLVQDRISQVAVTDIEGNTKSIPVDDLLIFFGLSPKLGPIADWDLEIQRKQIVVDTEKFQTSVPGIYAVGDINIYPGKKKLILSGFHEAALAQYLNPEKPIQLQYTTTSPKLHKVLGVKPPTFE